MEPKRLPYSVYLDNCVWDFLFDEKIDLSVEFPNEMFCLCITREAEFEYPAIPADKSGLLDFVEATIQKCVIRTDTLFGFAETECDPKEHRLGGFDVGRFVTVEESAFMHQQRTKIGLTKRKNGLYKNEADVALGARSYHSAVLTLDQNGPLNTAYNDGGCVVFLNDFHASNLTLREFVLRAIEKSAEAN
jgi:hypothetical protein